MKFLASVVAILMGLNGVGARPAQDPQPAAKIDSVKDADIRRLLDLTGTGRMAVQLR